MLKSILRGAILLLALVAGAASAQQFPAKPITLTATDGDGLYAQDSLALRVNAPPSAPSVVS